MAPSLSKPVARPPLLKRLDGGQLGADSRHRLVFARLRLISELHIMTSIPRDATHSERRRQVIQKHRAALEKHGLVVYTPPKIKARALSLEYFVEQTAETKENSDDSNEGDDAKMDSRS